MTMVDDPAASHGPAPKSRWQRLYQGETTFDFVGRRTIGFIISGVLIALTVVSLFTRDLNLGIDFEGGVSWEVVSDNVDQDRAEAILTANGISTRDAKIQFLSNRSSDGGDTIRIQAPEQSDAVRINVREELAEAAGVTSDEVSVSSVSSTWGEEITRQAVLALVVFLVLLMVYISWRFEWKMAIAAIAAMLHDVAISVGIYSLFQFVVTPATVIAFLTILGFSLYDTIVVFDKVHENAKRFANSKVSYGDIVNLSMNQVLMRSINTSIAAVLPVLSVLVVGSWIMGAVALTDFALALIVGLVAGSYSSIFIATPILAMLKQGEKKYAALAGQHASGEDLARLRTSGAVGLSVSRVAKSTSIGAATATVGSASEAARVTVEDPTVVLQHPPRPRKKRRR
jgi:preprotein translocase subunit SecF